jgi:hypothetical protein
VIAHEVDEQVEHAWLHFERARAKPEFPLPFFQFKAPETKYHGKRGRGRGTASNRTIKKSVRLGKGLLRAAPVTLRRRSFTSNGRNTQIKKRT